MKKWFEAGFVLAMLVLSGCIEQDVRITLNADGSGRIVVERNLSEMESGFLVGEGEYLPEFKAMSVERSLEDAEDTPFGKVERSVYTFANLAEALPELENAIPMMPRFMIRDGRLVVFIRHEMNEHHGFRQTDKTNSFYHLEIEFPVCPESESGQVEGTRFIWSVDHDAVETFLQSEIGTKAFECSIPASAVKLDLSPRLVEYEEVSRPRPRGKKKTKWIQSMDVNVPICGKSWVREGDNASLNIFLPVEQDQLPLCYEKLEVEQLVVDGVEVSPVLKSHPSGVFFGADQWGRPAPGLPVELRFGWDSYMLKAVDRIQVSMLAAQPMRTSTHPLRVEASNPADGRLLFAGHPGKQLGILKINHANNQNAMLKVLTNLQPDQLGMVYLDTDHGLRYAAKGMRWSEGKGLQTNEKELANGLFGDEGGYSVLEVLYPHIPTTAFGLVFELVEEKEMAELVLEKENIDVY